MRLAAAAHERDEHGRVLLVRAGDDLAPGAGPAAADAVVRLDERRGVRLGEVVQRLLGRAAWPPCRPAAPSGRRPWACRSRMACAAQAAQDGDDLVGVDASCSSRARASRRAAASTRSPPSMATSAPPARPERLASSSPSVDPGPRLDREDPAAAPAPPRRRTCPRWRGRRSPPGGCARRSRRCRPRAPCACLVELLLTDVARPAPSARSPSALRLELLDLAPLGLDRARVGLREVAAAQEVHAALLRPVELLGPGRRAPSRSASRTGVDAVDLLPRRRCSAITRSSFAPSVAGDAGRAARSRRPRSGPRASRASARRLLRLGAGALSSARDVVALLLRQVAGVAPTRRRRTGPARGWRPLLRLVELLARGRAGRRSGSPAPSMTFGPLTKRLKTYSVRAPRSRCSTVFISTTSVSV